MAARDIGGRASPGEIGPRIKGSMLPRMHAAPGAGEPGAGYDGRAMSDMGLAKKTVDYTMALASASPGIMTMILLLQGFGIYGF